MLKFSMPEKLGRENPDQNYRYGLKIPTFCAIEEEFLHSYARKVKTGKSSGLVENNRKKL
jgi:hypothetical protein